MSSTNIKQEKRAVAASVAKNTMVTDATSGPWWKPRGWASLVNALFMFLFYVQPGVDRSAIMAFLVSIFPSARALGCVTCAVLFPLAWIVPLVSLYGIYKLDHPALEKYRIQPTWLWKHTDETKRAEMMELLQMAVKQCIDDLVAIIIMAIIGMGVAYSTDGLTEEQRIEDLLAVPAWHVTFAKLMIGCLLFELNFYFWHYLMHNYPAMYKYHKKHHEFRQPLALTGTWGTPLDGLLTATLPGIGLMILLDMQLYEIYMWYPIHAFHSVYDHCGYDFPFTPLQLVPFSGYAREHNYHHSHNIGNFGLYWRFFDYFMGTDLSFQKFAERSQAERAKALSDSFYSKDE